MDRAESKQPWSKSYYRVGCRCNNPKSKFYHRYGGRGIKRLMSKEDFKTLWFRDKAFTMKHPSIDRIDNDGDYTLENCRYIELAENSRKGAKKDANFCVRGHEFVEGNFDWRGKHRRCLLCRKIQDAGRGKYEFMVKGKKDTKCSICGKTFLSKKHLLCHFSYFKARNLNCSNYWTVKILKCNYCGKEFSRGFSVLSDETTLKRAKFGYCSSLCANRKNNKTRLAEWDGIKEAK